MQAGVDEAPDILGDMTKELVKKVEDAVDVEAVVSSMYFGTIQH